MEDHLHLTLASTFILFLSPNRYPDEVKPSFKHDDWIAAVNFIHDMYGIKKLPMPLNTVTNMLAIIDNLLTKTINQEQAEINFKSLSLSSYEHKFVKALSALVTKLPLVSIEEDLNESELCTRFVDPFLSGLFDDLDNGMYLRWTNETTFEARIRPDLSNQRPDLCITKSCGVKWDTSCDFGEAKPAVHGQNHYLVCKDLLRAAVFCKNSLDNQHMDGILEIQIVGRTVKFYVLLLSATGLYVLLDLAEIMIPDSLQNLASLVTEMSNIMKTLHAFDNICVRTNDTETLIKRLTLTISTTMFDQVFSTSKSRKRQCYLKLRHN